MTVALTVRGGMQGDLTLFEFQTDRQREGLWTEDGHCVNTLLVYRRLRGAASAVEKTFKKTSPPHHTNNVCIFGSGQPWKTFVSLYKQHINLYPKNYQHLDDYNSSIIVGLNNIPRQLQPFGEKWQFVMVLSLVKYTTQLQPVWTEFPVWNYQVELITSWPYKERISLV